LTTGAEKKEMSNFQTTGNSKVKSVKCCILYDPANGEIYHVHRIVTMDNAYETTTKDLEERTLKLASEHGINITSMKLLHIDERMIESGKKYKVDVNNQRLEEIKEE
jgi:hypothetical protein